MKSILSTPTYTASLITLEKKEKKSKKALHFNLIKDLQSQGMAANISMAMFAPLLILISLAVIHHVDSDEMVITTTVLSASSEVNAESPLPQKIDCDGACKARCELSSRPRLCKRACGTCCARCDCVPPGTSGNYDACPCYANMTTHGGRHKCP